LDDLRSVFEVGARGIPEGVARSAIRLVLKHCLDVGAVLGTRPELLANAPMPELGQRLGQLHGQAVEFQIVAVGVLGEQRARRLTHPRADRDYLERNNVGPPRFSWTKKVRETQPAIASLAREREADAI